MKVFNLTDIETPLLRQYGYVRHTFVVGAGMLGPGEVVEVADELKAQLAAGLHELVRVGALAIDNAPAPYRLAKDKVEGGKKSTPPRPRSVPAPAIGSEEPAPKSKKGS